MKMQRKILGAVIVVSIWASIAAAGIDGGGGMVVTCKNSKGEIVSTELLDVFEARGNPQAKVMSASGDMYEDYYRTSEIAYTLQGFPDYAVLFKKQLITDARSIMAMIEWAGPLPFLNDQGELAASLAPGCSLQQLAIFYDVTEKIKVDKEIWQRLDSLSRAALLKHEIYYKFERHYAEHTSESTRSFIRQIVSTQGYLPRYDGLAAETETWPLEEIGGKFTTMMAVIRKSNDLGTEDLRLQFKNLGARGILVKTYVDIPDFMFEVTCHYTNSNSGAYRECKPSVPANKIIRVPVITEHRKDWELVIKYVTDEPVTLTLLQKGQPISEMFLTK